MLNYSVMKKLLFTPSVLLSLFSVMVLLGVQYYLINHVYQLKNTQFELGYSNGVNYVAPALRFSWKTTDSVAKHYQQQLTEKSRLATSVAFRTKVFAALGQILEGNHQMEQSLLANFKRNKIDTNFRYTLSLSRLSLKTKNNQVHTLLDAAIHSPQQYHLLGNLSTLSGASLVHSQFYTGRHFIMNLQVYVAFPHRRSFLFREMTGVFILSGFTLLITIAVFVYTIRNLLRHKQLSQTQNDFINNITHEITTPLATLGVAGKSLQKPRIQQNIMRINELAQLVEKQAHRLQRLFNQVIGLSVWDKDLLETKPEPVLLNNFVQETVQAFTLSVNKQEQRIETQLLTPNISVNIDVFHFTTLLYNLFDNALKYSKSGSPVIVSTSQVHTSVIIQVQDQGKGMNQHTQKHLFDKFYREETNNVHNVKGLGLGLYYAKKIVDAHGGSIEVHSKKGKGTLFEIKLPG